MNWFARLLGRDASAGAAGEHPLADPPSPSRPSPATESAATTHVRHGNTLLERGDLVGAAAQYRLAIQADAAHADARVNLAFTLIERGLAHEAIAPLRQAIALAPDSPDAHYLLGSAWLAQRAPAEAIGPLQRAAALKPDLAVAHRDLGRALHETGRHAEAIAALNAGLAASPGFADLHYFLGNVLANQMELDAALDSYQRALAIDPNYASVHSNMAPLLSDLGDFEGAAAAARRALAIDPAMHHARSNLLVALSCDPRCSPDAYVDEARAFGAALTALNASTDMVAAPVAATASADPAPRRLRIGFVSGDLRSHPVGYFLDGVLAHWNGADMEAIAYSNHPGADALTARLKARFGAWHDISGLDDDDAERRVRADRIDVLIDLSGHTAGNRLPLFARRPAPVQISWLGYWASTGLPAIDCVLADRVSVPPDSQSQFTETVWYLPDTRLCFAAPTEPGVSDVGALPALQAGHVTFGSFQRLMKINDGVLALRAPVLNALPESRLRLQAAALHNPDARARLLQRLAAVGIDGQRVTLAAAGTRVEYLAAHAQVDIVLDTFPHSGATTTCEALWMGVPTLTLAGGTMLSRQGASLLSCAGLEDWVAADADDFVERGMRHASDLETLARLRASLRSRISASPLLDARRFTIHLQTALRDLWHAPRRIRRGVGDAQRLAQ